MRTFDDLPPCIALAEMAKDFHGRGWMPGTAGNLSIRAVKKHASDAASFWITASGCPKGRLEETDFVRVDVNTVTMIEGLSQHSKPSAESSIHAAIYRSIPEIKACLHVHSVAACIVSERIPIDANAYPLPPVEMLKGLGIWERNPSVVLPVFENHFEVPVIAKTIENALTISPFDVPALLIRGHGVTAWGTTLQEAYNRIEALEFILDFMAR